MLTGALTSNYTRGAVTGLGLLNVWAAVAELADMFGSRRPPSRDDSESDVPNRHAEIRNQQW